jgi:hypothetical protein
MNVKLRHFRRVCECVRYPGFVAAPLVLIGLLSVAPASAQPPPIPVPTPDPIVLPGPVYPGTFCEGFTAVVTFPKFNQKIVQDTRVNGVGPGTYKQIGNAQATVTRQDDPKKSVNFNVSGPATVVVNADNSFSVDAHGPNLLWTASGNLTNFPDVPEISYTTGHVTFAVDASGQTTSYTLAGDRTDVCAALA